MSCYAEYLHASSEERRAEALADIKAECRRQEYYDREIEYDYDECEEDDLK